MIYPFQTSDLQNLSILDFKTGDVTGDGIIDYVYLVGKKTSPDAVFADKIELIIYDGKTNQLLNNKLENAAGYNSHLFLSNFSTKQRLDILINIDTGGSGKYILAYLYTISENSFEVLFNSGNFNKKSKYKAEFKENFKVLVSGNGYGNNVTFITDLSGKSKFYINNGVYTESGRLIKPLEGGVLGLGALVPHANDYASVLYQLLAYQRIIGRNNADNLGAVQTYIKWNGKEFTFDRVELAIMPL